MSNTAKHGTDSRNKTRTNTDRKHVASLLNTAQHNCARCHSPHESLRPSCQCHPGQRTWTDHQHSKDQQSIASCREWQSPNNLHCNALHLVATNSAMEQKLGERIKQHAATRPEEDQFLHTRQHATKITPQLKSQNHITNQRKHTANINISYKKTTQTYMAHARLHAVSD